LLPGAEYYNHFIIRGLSYNKTYYFAVTAIDTSNNESQPIVIPAIIEGCLISGVVKDSSGNGIPEVSIEAYNEAGDFIDMGGPFPSLGITTDESGNYEIFVPSGSFKLYFDPPRGNHSLYSGEWYDNKMDFSKADLITAEDQEQEKVNSVGSETLSISGTPVTGSLSLSQGWNLVGLKSNESKSITDLISENENNIASIWKWESGAWAVYLPNQNTQAYADSKGFAVLEDIEPGEGFWVNCSQAVELQ